MQNDQPIAFYSRKLNSAQRNYSTIEKELLSIIETLKEFRTMLYGCWELHVHTDHKNLTNHNLTSQRVLRWRLFLEEYHPIFHYIKGSSNTLADSLSRLPRMERQSDMAVKQPNAPTASDNQFAENHKEAHFFLISLNDDSMLDCFLNFLEVTQDEPFPVNFKTIQEEQDRDAELLQLLHNEATKFARQVMSDNTNLICYVA